MEYEKQVSADHYSFAGYFHQLRWASLWYQLNEIISRKEISSVLDIGPGSKFLKTNLELFRPDISYQSLDIAADQNPDIVGSVTDIPLDDKAVDLITAFQVLEHIEFSDFETALKELKRVTKKYVFISLPHNQPSFDFECKLPGIKRFKFAYKFPFLAKHEFNGQHYWEVGKKGYGAKKITAIFKKHFRVLSEYVPHENQYHHFYILEKVDQT